MARDRRYDLEDLANRAGTYFNPQTEVLVIVDDSSTIDSEIFNMEQFEGADWVLISDDVPIDEAQRDEILETFQSTYSGGDGRGPDAEDEDDDVENEYEDEADEFGDDDADSYGDEDE